MYYRFQASMCVFARRYEHHGYYKKIFNNDDKQRVAQTIMLVCCQIQVMRIRGYGVAEK